MQSQLSMTQYGSGIHSINVDSARYYRLVHFSPYSLPYQAKHWPPARFVRHASLLRPNFILRAFCSFSQSRVRRGSGSFTDRAISILLRDGALYYFVIFLANLMNALFFFVCISSPQFIFSELVDMPIACRSRYQANRSPIQSATIVYCGISPRPQSTLIIEE